MRCWPPRCPKFWERCRWRTTCAPRCWTRDGELGALLALVEALEISDLVCIERALERVPGLDHGRVIGLQVEAMRWADSIGEPE